MRTELLILSYSSVRTFVFGAQKNRLSETGLLSTHNIYVFGKEIKKIILNFAFLETLS